MSSPAGQTGTLLEIYKTAVEMADRVSARRAGANSFFVTLNTVIVGVVGITSAARKPLPNTVLPSFDAFGLCVTAAAGSVLAIVWWALLRYYRRLSRAKWEVIGRLEKLLPASPFTDEWAELNPKESVSEDTSKGPRRRFRLWKRVKHREATVVEQTVPFVFVSLYVILAIRVVVQ
jgi:hypothetical protein